MLQSQLTYLSTNTFFHAFLSTPASWIHHGLFYTYLMFHSFWKKLFFDAIRISEQVLSNKGLLQAATLDSFTHFEYNMDSL